MFVNVVTNARKAIGNKGRIVIRTFKSADDVLIVFSDSGGGMNEAIMKQAFDPFFSTKSPGEGTGLGLSISYSIIKEHNGSIELRSTVDKGTDVIIKLPKKV